MSRPKAALSDEVSPLGSTSIQSVERAVALLRLFLPNVGSLGPTDIAQRSGMSVSTAHRYCAALRKAGLLRYDPATGRYGLGGGCIELGLAAAESMPVVELARPLMSDLVTRLAVCVDERLGGGRRARRHPACLRDHVRSKLVSLPRLPCFLRQYVLMTAVRLREWHGVTPTAGPPGTAITTRLRTTPADDAVLDAVAGHLGRLRRADLATTSHPEPLPGLDAAGKREARRLGSNTRKRGLTAVSSARWANAIIVVNDAQCRSAREAQDLHIADLRAATGAIERRPGRADGRRPDP